MKKKLIKPSAKEDILITKAARSDPDSRPLTEKEWKRIKPNMFAGAVGLSAVAVRSKLPYELIKIH